MVQLSGPVANIFYSLRSIAADLLQDPAAATRLQQTYQHGSVSSEDRRTFLLQEAKGLALFNEASRLRKAILPAMVAPGVYMASQDDNLREPSPVKLQHNHLGKFVVSLGSLEDVLAANFFYLSDTTHNPANTNMPGQDDPPDDLHFPFGDPVFVMLPVVFPFGRGDVFPDSLDLTQPLPDWVADLQPPLRVWIRGMWWLHSHNDKRSVHFHEIMFRSSEIPVANFEAQGVSFVPEAFSTCITEPHGNPNCIRYKVLFRAASKSIAQEIYDSNPSADAMDVDDTVQAGASTNEAQLRAVASAVASVFERSKKESEAGDTAKIQDATDFYRILFASRSKLPQPDGSIKQVLEFPTLSDEFIQVLKEKKPADAARTLHRSWKDWCSTFDQHSSISWQTLFQYDIEVWQNAAVVALKYSMWADRSLNYYPGDAKTKLSLFHFGASDPTDPAFLDHKNANAIANMEEFVGEDKMKQTKKKLDLHLPTVFRTFGHLLTMVANFIGFCAFAVKDFSWDEPPLVVELTREVMSRFSSMDAKSWMAHVDTSHMPISVALEVDRVIQCMVSAAGNSRHKLALRSDSLTDPAIFMSAIRLHKRTFNKIDEAIHDASLGDFQLKPPFASYICGECTTSSSSSGKRKGDSSSESTPEKKQKDLKKEKGIFIYEKTGKPVGPDFKVKDKSGNERTLCLNFAFVGYACNRPDCKLYHFTLSTLKSHPQRTKINKWVKDTPFVKYAPGAEPQDGVSSSSTAFDDFTEDSLCLDQLCLSPSSSITMSSSPSMVTTPDSSERMTEVVRRLPAQFQIRLMPLQKLIFQGRPHTTDLTTATQDEILSKVPSRVRLATESPFGKDSIDRCFATERTFRHTWIFLFKSGYLVTEDLYSLFEIFRPALLLWALWKEHLCVDFRPLRSPIPVDLSPAVALHRWGRMFTACLLHFNLDLPSAVRYVGHIHTGSHRDWNLLESNLKAAQADQQLIKNIRRVFFDGCPNYVNATSSEANRRAFAEYGNHPTVKQHAELTMKAIQKDVLRHYVLPANPALSPFIPDMQLIPQGLVLVPGKSPRQVCDSSHHPLLDSMAVNDWTNKATEPAIIFAGSFMRFLIWMWNLRITYPTMEIYVGDDDVSGAFRHAKNNPNVIGMNAFMLLGFLFFATGQTFGGNTCPPNWEVFAIARMLLARFLWTLADTVTRALPFLPPITKAPAPISTQFYRE